MRVSFSAMLCSVLILSLPSLLDLSSTVIPVDDEEEEEEETYDDIEGASGPPLPQSGTSLASLSGMWGGGNDAGAVDEENEDIYEVLPGTSMW